MISPDYVRVMARYNAWQNLNVYGAVAGLPDVERHADRGAFFGSIFGTLNHLLWGDQVWMHRLAGTDKPSAASIAGSVLQYETWQEMSEARDIMDAEIGQWAQQLEEGDLQGPLTWMSPAAGREVTKPRWVLVTHMFNHQTHHRGQVHVMLTSLGTLPGDTDIPFMPEG